MARFDEIELTPAAIEPPPAVAAIPEHLHASRIRRLFALLTDLSLFAALALALSPLLPASLNWQADAALGGFILIISYYYFAGTWWLWGKTIGGTIFDVKVIASGSVPLTLRSASLRWLGLVASLLSGGIGFLPALLPSRLSLSDRLSRTCAIAG